MSQIWQPTFMKITYLINSWPKVFRLQLSWSKKIIVGCYLHIFSVLDPDLRFKSQKLKYIKSTVVCTQNKHIWTTITTQQTKTESEFRRPGKLPKTTQKLSKSGYIVWVNIFRWFWEVFSVVWTPSPFLFAVLWSWFKCNSFDLILDDLIFDLK